MADAALNRLIDQLQTARATRSPLAIRGGGSKDFYGEPIQGDVLDTRTLTGLSSYEPTELVVTVRAGTPLAELEATLADKGQCLPFDPPHFGAGPARAAVGGVRDYVLGATLLNGRAEVMSFGGQVMKNVAGYDVSRLLVGSMGVLGLLCEVSLKVLPVAPAVTTLRFEMDQTTALARLNAWGGQPLPLNASAWWDGALVLRLAGAAAAVRSTAQQLGGEVIPDELARSFWDGLRDQSDEFFQAAHKALEGGAALWRLSLPSTAAPVVLSGEQLIEWGGAQRWWVSAAPPASVREAAARVGGHATLFRGRDKSSGVLAPLKPPLDRIHRELKKAFDPERIFNPGRLYPDL
jgi:glycolate oxidase FAD binding subunit